MQVFFQSQRYTMALMRSALIFRNWGTMHSSLRCFCDAFNYLYSSRSLVRKRVQKHLLGESTLSLFLPLVLYSGGRKHTVWSVLLPAWWDMLTKRTMSSHCDSDMKQGLSEQWGQSGMQIHLSKTTMEEQRKMNVTATVKMIAEHNLLLKDQYISINKEKKSWVLFLHPVPGFYWSQWEFGDDANAQCLKRKSSPWKDR